MEKSQISPVLRVKLMEKWPVLREICNSFWGKFCCKTTCENSWFLGNFLGIFLWNGSDQFCGKIWATHLDYMYRTCTCWYLPQGSFWLMVLFASGHSELTQYFATYINLRTPGKFWILLTCSLQWRSFTINLKIYVKYRFMQIYVKISFKCVVWTCIWLDF